MTTIRGKDNELQDLISAAQNVTGSWAALGEEIDVRDWEKIGLWLKIDINDALNFRLRMVVIDGSDTYLLPIRAVAATVVSVSPEYFEFTDDADQNMVFDFDVLDVVNKVQFQISAGTAGATPGQVDSAKVTFKTIGVKDVR